MENADLPGKKQNASAQPPIDDIPAALRDAPRPKRRYRLKPAVLIGGMVVLGAIAFITGLLIGAPTRQPAQTGSQPSPTPTAEASAEEILLGHFAYQEAPTSELQPITPDGRIKLRKAAAQKYKDMEAAARKDGVRFIPISGFRSVKEQQGLFFDVKAKRGQVAKERAEVSAPPGYSEHHTGYAIDIGDARAPGTNLSPRFENTASFKWLDKNAPRFGFEISFPRDNPQGVSYEPWHWRYVGDTHSLETFYKGRSLKPQPQPQASETPSP